MSKAFTKEDEGGGLEEAPPVEAWPAGLKNYLTPAGYAALRRQIDLLRETPRGDAQAGLRADGRLAALLQRLEAAEVIEPGVQPRDVVRFGARVSVEGADGEVRRYRIVGVDEAEPKRGLVSWRSPVAKALTGRRVGEAATLRTPAGDEELTVVAIDYE